MKLILFMLKPDTKALGNFCFQKKCVTLMVSSTFEFLIIVEYKSTRSLEYRY